MKTLEDWFIAHKNREEVPETAVVEITSTHQMEDFMNEVEAYRQKYPFMKSPYRNTSEQWDFYNAKRILKNSNSVYL